MSFSGLYDIAAAIGDWLMSFWMSSFQPVRLGSVWTTQVPLGTLDPPIMRSTVVVSIVAPLAPVRHGLSYGTRLSVFSARPRRCGWP